MNVSGVMMTKHAPHRAAAIKLGAAGAEVILAARSADRLETARRTIEKAGGIAHAYQVDLQMRRGNQRIAVGVRDELGSVESFVTKSIDVAG